MVRKSFRVAGVDFGTDSVRVGVWDLSTRQCQLVVSEDYPRWAANSYCAPERQQFRQHPLDYLEALERVFAQVAQQLGPGAIQALAIDATGSTPAPTDGRGVPLAMHPEHADDPDCMFWLWKDHVASTQAERITRTLEHREPDYTSFQGLYSAEWWWAKILHGATHRDTIRSAGVSWVELSDWVANLIVGNDDVTLFARNSCAAGHKALFNAHLGGPVPSAFLAELDPYLASVAQTCRVPPVPAGTRLGTLSAEWAERLRLDASTVVGMGSLDAHAGGVAVGIAPGTLVEVVGTSTVDLFLTDYDSISGHDLRGSAGMAEDSIVPGYLGGEAGQAAFGDLFAWWARVLDWSWDAVLRRELEAVLPVTQVDAVLARGRARLLPELDQGAARRGPSAIVATDWLNGRRYPNVDDRASMTIAGLRVGHDAADVYRALVQAAVLGSKAIFAGLAGVAKIERVVLTGGVARHSAVVCQALADGLGMDVMVSDVDEACAMGSAIYAAVAAGAFPSIPAAQQALCAPYRVDYRPTKAGRAEYERAFGAYRSLGESVGNLGASAPTPGGSSDD